MMTSVLKVTFYLQMVETDDDFCTKSDFCLLMVETHDDFCTKSDFLLTDGRNRR